MQPERSRLSSLDTKGLFFFKGQLSSHTKIMLLCQLNGTELILFLLLLLPLLFCQKLWLQCLVDKGVCMLGGFNSLDSITTEIPVNVPNKVNNLDCQGKWFADGKTTQLER